MDSLEPAEPGEVGRVVVTDLYSHATPLIRYDLGDTAVISANLSQPYEMPMLDSLEGRLVDMIYATEGERISSYAVNHCVWGLPSLLQYQFSQTGEKDYVIKLVIFGGRSGSR